MTILLTTPLEHEDLINIRDMVTDNIGNHISNINCYFEFMAYDTGNRSKLLSYQQSLSKQDFNNFEENLVTPARLKHHIGDIVDTPAIVEDCEIPQGVTLNVEKTTALLENIKQYNTYIGKERIAEKIILKCESILNNPIFLNIIQVYDADTLCVLKEFMKRQYIPFKTMHIENKAEKVLIEAASNVKDFKLALDDNADIKLTSADLQKQSQETKDIFIELCLTASVKEEIKEPEKIKILTFWDKDLKKVVNIDIDTNEIVEILGENAEENQIDQGVPLAA